jgi:hypothetical protein
MPNYPGSIAYDYFIKNKKCFRDLEWSTKKCISFLIHSSEQNTGNWVIFNQANKLIEGGYEVKIYSLTGGWQNWFPLKTPVENFPAIFSNKRPDVLVATYWTTVYASHLISAKEKYHFFQDWGEDLHRNFLFKFFARKAYTFPHKKITISRYLENKVRSIVKNPDIKNYLCKPKYKIFKPIPKII